MKIDPYNHKKKYLSWKNSIKGRIPNLSEKNSRIVLDYIFDMEHGINVASGSRKGARGYPRLNNLRQRAIFLINQFEKGNPFHFGCKTWNLHRHFPRCNNSWELKCHGCRNSLFFIRIRWNFNFPSKSRIPV